MLKIGVLLASLALCSACATDPGDQPVGPQVVASFYPLQFVTERVLGERGAVTALTPAGAEPHDLELGPRDVGRLGEADLVVTLGGFQPAVDAAIKQQAADSHLDVAEAARLETLSGAQGHEDAGHEDAEHEDAEPSDLAGDPHFWLDPLRLADVADAVAERLAEIDPDGAQTYQQHASTLRADLEALDDELAAGLSGCESTELVTSHTAFGYLAERYGLEQVGIAGLSPHDEPSARTLAEITDYVREHEVTTVFSEVLSDPAVAQVVSTETGARLAVLDPVEGISPDSAGQDYLAVMRANLQVLQEGLSCP